MTIRIWLYVVSLLLAAGLGGFILALCVAGSVADRASVAERRALELSLALRELMVQVQTFVDGGVWKCELPEALSRAAEVLHPRTGEDT